jgi:hypothetical protein
MHALPCLLCISQALYMLETVLYLLLLAYDHLLLHKHYCQTKMLCGLIGMPAAPVRSICRLCQAAMLLWRRIETVLHVGGCGY